RSLPSPLGGRRIIKKIMMMARRLRLTHPVGHLPRAVGLTRVRALWKNHPHYTVKQLIASSGPLYPLGTTRVERWVRALRAAVANRSAVHQQVGWPLDCRTVTRIRIGALWQRHPQFTARQVIQTLGPGPFLTNPWVQRILRECWRASRRRSRIECLNGRRCYPSWRARDQT